MGGGREIWILGELRKLPGFFMSQVLVTSSQLLNSMHVILGTAIFFLYLT